jgi:hypothetical protein
MISRVFLLELEPDLTTGAIKSPGRFPLASTELGSAEASSKSLATSGAEEEPPAAAQ